MKSSAKLEHKMESAKKTPDKLKKTPKKQNKDKKAVINNEIIQYQEKFKQAKICTVRKLVQKLKNPEKNPKQNRAAKTERYQNVLDHLKHMPPKRLGLLALLHYKSGKNYLADQNSTVEQLAVGYFSEYKTMNGILDAIRKKLNLHESQLWKKTSKKLFKKKDKTEQADKMNKKTPFTETENGEENSGAKNKKKKTKQTSETNGKVSKSDKGDKKQTKSKKATAEQDAASESDESSESEEENDLESTSAPAPTTVDEFFITADGANYLSTAVTTSKQENNKPDDDQTEKVFPKRSKESSFFHKSDKKPVKLAVNRFENKKRTWTEHEEAEPAKETKLDPELHPSWQAKQKQKPIITEFKGKKITFD